MCSITSYGSTYCRALDQLITDAFEACGYSLVAGNSEPDPNTTGSGDRLSLAKTLATRRIPNTRTDRACISVGLAVVLSINSKHSNPLGKAVSNRERSIILKRLTKKDEPVMLAFGIAIRIPTEGGLQCSHVLLGDAEIKMTIDHVPNPTATGPHAFWTEIGNALRIADPDGAKETLIKIISRALPQRGV
ncbi:MAG: hypothetical protein HGB18_04120 [Candidatus Moranbacteria bacterium]|nr:hypothetical protein [Candidatus Moranbacteria bacterium]